MAPQIRAKYSGKQELLRCESRGPEAERKGLLALACLPEVQEKHQAPPFLNNRPGQATSREFCQDPPVPVGRTTISS